MLVSFFNKWFCDLPACKLEDWNVTISHRPHSLFMQTVWSGLHYQFLCHVLKALFFIKIALKLSYFWKKCEIFRHWGLCPQTPVPPAAGGSAPRPPHIAPKADFCLRTRQLYTVYNYKRFCRLLPWATFFDRSDANLMMLSIDVRLALNCFLFEKFYLHCALCDFDSIL